MKKLIEKDHKKNLHIPSPSDIFAIKENKVDWWLPFSRQINSPIKKDTSKLALQWANTETHKQFWI